LFIAIFVLLGTIPLQGDEWEALRNRPGNDDLFVMIDTSTSMAPSRGGALPSVRILLRDLFARFLKDGDRVILMTFDSDAHVRSIVSVAERRRDVALLRDVVDGIDASRVVHYRGTYPDLVETAGGTLAGGGARTDYCEMWRLSMRAIQEYGDPTHRQVLLLLTDGLPDAPLYRRCDDPGMPGSFAGGMREDRIRLAVITLSNGAISAEALEAYLIGLLRKTPGYEEIRQTSLKVLAFKPNGRHIDSLRSDILKFLGSRVDLVSPRSLNLGASYQVRLDVPLTIINRSRIRKMIDVRGATLVFAGSHPPVPLVVTPRAIMLAPDQAGVFRLRGDPLLRAPGDYRGRVVFEFGTASRFAPAILSFSVKKQNWFDAGAQSSIWIAMGLLGAIIITMILRLTYKTAIANAPTRIRTDTEVIPLRGETGT
jgi:hypothetical protein